MPTVTLDPIISYEGNPGTTISGDPTETFNPIVLPPATTYGGNVLVEPLEPINPIESNDPAVPIQNNPNNSVNYLVGSIREEVVSENTQIIETPINQTTTSTATSGTTYVPPKPNTAIMGGGGSGSSSSVSGDLKTADKKYWWWIVAAVVGIGLYSYKKSK